MAAISPPLLILPSTSVIGIEMPKATGRKLFGESRLQRWTKTYCGIAFLFDNIYFK
jgi:hypothetical protein